MTAWTRQYRRDWLAADLIAGLVAGSVVVPQAMAYATVADLPAEFGLYTCMVPAVVYALVGGSRTMSVSTTSTVAVLTASTLLAADLAADGDPARDLATITITVGVVLLIARALRWGSVLDGVSMATLTGVKLSVGLTVAAGQLPALLGIEGDPDASHFIAELRGVVADLDQVDSVTVALSTATLAVLIATKRFAPRVPGPLVALTLGIAAVAVWSIDDHGVALIAPVPSGLPRPVAPTFDRFDDILPGAIAIALLCFMESAAVAGSVRRPNEPVIDNDRELLANGLVCFVAGWFRSMPAAGGFSQTAMNQNAGARTQLSSLTIVALAVGCALFLGGVLSDLPAATLASLVLVAVIGLIRPSELRRFWKLDRAEFWVAVATAGFGLVLGMLAAVLAGMLLTVYLVLRELTRVGFTELQPTSTGDDLRPASAETAAEPGLLIARLDGPLYTANARAANRRLLAMVDETQPQILVIDATAQVAMSVSAFDQFLDLRRELDRRQIELWLTSVPPHVLQSLQSDPDFGAGPTAPRIFATNLEALRTYRLAGSQVDDGSDTG